MKTKFRRLKLPFTYISLTSIPNSWNTTGSKTRLSLSVLHSPVGELEIVNKNQIPLILDILFEDKPFLVRNNLGVMTLGGCYLEDTGYNLNMVVIDEEWNLSTIADLMKLGPI
jgi:hypothetical protein